MEKHKIVREAYLYGYPLVTLDMTRKHETNVREPDDAHAPMGQLVKLRTYPAVDDHGAAAPNADTAVHDGLARRVGTSRGCSHPRHGGPVLHHAYVERLQRGVLRGRLPGHRRRAQEYVITGPGWSGTLPDGLTHVESPTGAGVDPRAGLLRGHAGGLQGGPRSAGPVLVRSAQRLRQALHATARRRRRHVRHEDGGPQAGQRPAARGLLRLPRRAPEDEPAEAARTQRSSRGWRRSGSCPGSRSITTSCRTWGTNSSRSSRFWRWSVT